MKQNANAVQLSFLTDSEGYEVKIRVKIAELKARKQALQSDAQKVVPGGTKVFIYYEEKLLISRLNYYCGSLERNKAPIENLFFW